MREKAKGKYSMGQREIQIWQCKTMVSVLFHCRRISMSGMRQFFHISVVFGLALLILADDSSR